MFSYISMLKFQDILTKNTLVDGDGILKQSLQSDEILNLRVRFDFSYLMSERGALRCNRNKPLLANLSIQFDALLMFSKTYVYDSQFISLIHSQHAEAYTVFLSNGTAKTLLISEQT